MGGVFKPSKVETPAPAPTVTETTDTDAEAQKRKEAQERQRRGLESNIKTSYQGILRPNEDSFKRKKLLGE